MHTTRIIALIIPIGDPKQLHIVSKLDRILTRTDKLQPKTIRIAMDSLQSEQEDCEDPPSTQVQDRMRYFGHLINS
jgi:hypothetical protein